MEYKIVKTVPIRVGQISLTNDDIIVFDIGDDQMINYDDTQEMRAVVTEITQGIPKPMVVITGERVGSTKEAREADLNKKPNLSLCEAVVITSFPTRIAGKFFYNIYSPPHPWKFFSNEEDAYDWALTFKK